MDELHEKLSALRAEIRALGSLAVAYSAGVDSTFLLKIAHDELGDGALALTVRSSFCPPREAAEAEAFCRAEGIRHILADVDVLAIPGVADNPPERCYLCKRALFARLRSIAEENGAANLAEGSNMDDLGDYRPGLRAVAELGVLSPLRKAGLYKAEIRQLSRELGLDTWAKPSFACLASRFVYGERLTTEKLAMVDAAEQYLMGLGLKQLRVRLHGDMARIEAEPGDFGRLTDPETAAAIDKTLRALGFSRVTLDLRGYCTGSMNADLPR